MQATDATTRGAPAPATDWQAEALRLRSEVDSLKQQLDWFQRQLFGRKSEKRLIDNPDQLGLAEVLGEAFAEAPAPATEDITYTRRKGKTRGDDCVTDTGLRFDDRVPIEVIELSAPQLQGPDADRYEILHRREKILRHCAAPWRDR